MTQPAQPMPRSRPAPDPAALAAVTAERCGYHWTTERALVFLSALAHFGRVAEAARAVGMARQSAYRLRARLGGTAQGQRFAQQWDLALATGQVARRERGRRRTARVTLAPQRDVFGIGR